MTPIVRKQPPARKVCLLKGKDKPPEERTNHLVEVGPEDRAAAGLRSARWTNKRYAEPDHSLEEPENAQAAWEWEEMGSASALDFYQRYQRRRDGRDRRIYGAGGINTQR